MKILVIGGVAAGMKAAAKARRMDERAEITVLERGRLVSYGACGMPYYIGGDLERASQLLETGGGAQRDAKYFKESKNIDVRTRTEALEIDRANKKVRAKRLDDGAEEWFPYDKLVIATGSSPVKPPFPGLDLANIFTLWHPDDAETIRRGIDEGKFRRAVIIGAGLIGVETAEALIRRRLDVAMVEMQPHVFPAFLDPEMAEIVQKEMADKGVKLYFGDKVEKFEGMGGVSAVVTDRRRLEADVVIMGIGTRPNAALAKAAGLALGETGAILVDDEMRTEDPDIYAGGDCVESRNMLTGKKVFAPMGSTANKQGRVIGENLFGKHETFRGVLGTVVARVMDVNVGKTGLTEKDARAQGYDVAATTITGMDRLHYMPGAGSVTLKLIADAQSRKVLGIQAVGPGDVSKRVDVVATAVTLGATIDDLFAADLSYAPPFNAPIDIVATAANVLMNKLEGTFKGVSAAEAKEKAAAGDAVFLDVRSPGEWKAERLCNCGEVLHIPLNQLRKKLDEVPPGTSAITLCKMGQRGYEAQRILEAAGFRDVVVLEGGIIAWPYDRQKDK